MDQNQGTGTGTSPETSSGDQASGAGSDGRFAKAKEFVGTKASAAADAIRDGYGTASESVRNQYTAVRGKVEEIDFEDVAERTRTYVRSNPGKALLISVGVGFALGMLLRRSDED